MIQRRDAYQLVAGAVFAVQRFDIVIGVVHGTWAVEKSLPLELK